MAASQLRWELVGIALIFLCGSALHSAFAWSGRLAILAPFLAVNESVWEHLKLAFWPSIIYALVEYVFFGRHAANFAFAKSVGIVLMPLTIVILFYGYTALSQHHILWVDILIFFIAVAAGQLVSYRLLRAGWSSDGLNVVGLAAVLLLAAGFALLTFAPQPLAIFRDSTTGTYGISQ
jgi:hypothetical protein